MINKSCKNLQYNSGDFGIYYISFDKSVRDSIKKITIKYVGHLVIYKVVDPHNYLLMMLDGKILRGLFEHEM